ncbi:DNA double-strand break repair helicase HerA [Candidatus Tiddalikarchaeum anstoanum]|nr:DNA double-strand break repair helicase HerA [Candidatus Tiddalikarchaeum anstoanum]
MNAGFVGSVFGKINTHNFTFKAEAAIKKFDYIKLYHEEAGFILAQVIELTSEENNITATCEIIGYRDSRGVLKVPNSTVKHNSEIYIADSNFIKNVLGLDKEDGLYLGLLDNYNMIQVKIDVKNLVTKHLAVLAKTGAGKSYTLGVIVEDLIEKGVPCVVIDPHGEYSSLKFKNTSKNDLELMHRYDVQPKSYEQFVDEYSPNVSVNPGAKPLSISINSLSAHEIATLTPIKVSGTQLGLLFNAISDVKKENSNYSLLDIRQHLDSMNSNMKYGLYACLEFIENVGVFSDSPIDVSKLVNPGRATLINLRGVPPDIQQIIVAKLCSDLFEKRKTNELPPFFLIIEEAHNFCPERSFGETPSSYILRNIASEGRKFGLGLGIVSQRPARVDKNVLSQCNTQIIHKVTNPNDLKAIANSAENIGEGVIDDIATLPIGTALVIGASVKPVFIDIRVRRSEHGGKTVSVVGKTPVSKPVEKVNVQEKPEVKLNTPLKPVGVNPNNNAKISLPPKPVVVKFTVEAGKVERKEFEITAPKIDTVPVNIISAPNSLDNKGLLPFFMAEVNDGVKKFKLLVNDECRIVSFQNNKLIVVNTKPYDAKSLGLKAEAVLNLVKDKGTTTISVLFNTLNYPFQDIDFCLKELAKMNLIIVNGGKIMIKGVDYSSYSLNKNIETFNVKKNELVNMKTGAEQVKNYLENNKLKSESIVQVYVKS